MVNSISRTSWTGFELWKISFKYAEVEEGQKVKFVAYKLKAGWEQLQYNRKREGKSPISFLVEDEIAA